MQKYLPANNNSFTLIYNRILKYSMSVKELFTAAVIHRRVLQP